MSSDDPDEAERQGLQDDVDTTLREGRMILPGVQTLFAFQLSVVFTERFQANTNLVEQIVHFVSLSIVACTIAVVLLPAAYHRRVHPGVSSRRFARFATSCLRAALALTTIGMGLNFYLVADVMFHRPPWSIVAGAAAMCIFATLWFIVPSLASAHRTTAEARAAGA